MNSTTKIIAGVAVLALLFAAVGYATYTGTAKTYNEDNEVKSEFATITFDSWTPFTGADAPTINFNSYSYDDEGTKIVYKPTLDGQTTEVVTIGTVEKTGLKLGEKTLTFTNNTESAIASFNLVVDAKAAIAGTDFTYYIQVSEVGEGEGLYEDIKPLTEASLTFPIDGKDVAVAGTADYKVALYLVYQPTKVVPETEVGPATDPEEGQVADWVVSTPEAVAKVKIDAEYWFKFTASNFTPVEP